MKRFLGACVTHYRNLGGCDLPGCVPDGESALLRLRELYDFDKLVILNDGDADRESILQHLREAVRDSEDGDEFVFLYSGHGTQVLDDSGREAAQEDIETAGDESSAIGQLVKAATRPTWTPILPPVREDGSILKPGTKAYEVYAQGLRQAVRQNQAGA